MSRVRMPAAATTPRDPADRAQLTGIEILRRLVKRFSACREDAIDGYTVAELIAIDDAWSRSDWDIYPDQWTARQLREAIRDGRAPTWDADERPTYEPRARKVAPRG